MSLGLVEKDPQSVETRTVDWGPWLSKRNSDTISSSTFSVNPSGTLTIDSDTNDTTTATVWLSKGTPGQTYRVVNQIVTAAGRTEERSFRVRVVER